MTLTIRQLQRIADEESAKYGAEFVTIDIDPRIRQAQADMNTPPQWAMRNRDFLAQYFIERREHAATYERLSINRTQLRKDGRWAGDISWDELMFVKNAVGFGTRWAIELYPPVDGVVDVANMRHLWLLHAAPPMAWKAGQ